MTKHGRELYRSTLSHATAHQKKSRSFWTIFQVKLNEAWWFKLVLILWWFLLENIYCNNGIFGGHNFLTVLFLHLAHVEDFLISTCERLKHLFLPTRSGNTRRENNNMWNVSNGMEMNSARILVEILWHCIWPNDVWLFQNIDLPIHWDLEGAISKLLRRRRSYDLQNWFINDMNDHESWTCMQDLILNKITDACRRCDHWFWRFLPWNCSRFSMIYLNIGIAFMDPIGLYVEDSKLSKGGPYMARFWTPLWEVSIILSFNF